MSFAIALAISSAPTLALVSTDEHFSPNLRDWVVSAACSCSWAHVTTTAVLLLPPSAGASSAVSLES